MRTKPGRIAFVITAALALAGCGALFNNGPETVTFTSVPDGADVYIDGTRRGTTPLSIPLSKSKEYVVTFRKDGYDEVVATVNRRVAKRWVILDVLGGLVPIIIDAATGSWYVLTTDSVHGTLDTVDQEPAGQLSPEALEAVRRGVPVSRFIEAPAGDAQGD